MGWDIMSLCTINVFDVLINKFSQTVCMHFTNKHFFKHIACNINTQKNKMNNRWYFIMNEEVNTMIQSCYDNCNASIENIQYKPKT
jgi:hypothetical protein